MDIKKMIIILSITITLLVGMLFGSSYAWYAYSNAESEVEGSTIKEVPTVIFAQTEYIKASYNMPIDDVDRYNYANKNSFTVTVCENLKDYQVGVEIVLDSIKMADELKISNYKYELLQNGVSINHGDFSLIENDNTLKLLPMTILNPSNYPETYTYDLFIWLSDDGSNQNLLMDKDFSAKISINSAVKK